MRRLFALVLAVSVLLTLAAAPAVGKASITAPDGLHFGDTFMPTYVAPTNLHGDYLLASASCQAATGGWAQTIYLDGPTVLVGPSVFTIGPSVTWQSGPATCVVSLVLFDAQHGWPGHVIASDPFEVAG